MKTRLGAMNLTFQSLNVKLNPQSRRLTDIKRFPVSTCSSPGAQKGLECHTVSGKEKQGIAIPIRARESKRRGQRGSERRRSLLFGAAAAAGAPHSPRSRSAGCWRGPGRTAARTGGRTRPSPRPSELRERERERDGCPSGWQALVTCLGRARYHQQYETLE